MKKDKTSRNIAVGTELTRECYEQSVMTRMTGRAGSATVKGAPGNALEILANDKRNISNALKPETVTKLTKSSTAHQVDAVTTKAGKVVERIQYKDTVSNAGVQKTLKQVTSGKYRQAQLYGTKEAAEKFNAAAKANNVAKNMKSTGISHNTTQRIGDKLTQQAIKPASLGNAVKGSVVTAVGITAGVEIVKSVKNGDSVGECTGHVVSKGTESAVNATVATVAGEVAMSLLATSAIPVAGPVIACAGIGAAVVAGSIAGNITDGVFDDIGDSIGDAIDDIGTELTCFLCCLF